MSMKVRVFIATLTLALLASACGADDSSPSAGEAPSASASMDMGGEHESFSFGEPADVADADSVVQVTATDDLTFDPADVTVNAGDTVAFEVSNPGSVTHEFVIGDAAFQEEHEAEMAGMEDVTMMADEASAIVLEPGETRSIAWTFSTPGIVEYACHVPGHYPAGMRGTVTVEA